MKRRMLERGLGAVVVLAVIVGGACSSISTCADCAQTPRPAAGGTRPSPAPQRLPVEERTLNVSALEKRLDALRRGGRSVVRYLPAERTEWNVYGDWVAESLRAAERAGSAPPAPRGFAIEALPQDPLWLLHEAEGQRRGAGAVVLRVGAANALVLEAPHTFFDADTLPLSLRLFDALGARALVINTVHRANVAQGLSDAAEKELARQGAFASDMAHADAAFFTSAHAALSRELPRAIVVQLHGFRDELAPFDAIVSAGGGAFDVAPLVRELRQRLPDTEVAAYPEDTRELGGTTNSQAGVSRRFDTPFVHVELSRTLRTRLLDDAMLSEAFLRAFQSALSVSPMSPSTPSRGP